VAKKLHKPHHKIPTVDWKHWGHKNGNGNQRIVSNYSDLLLATVDSDGSREVARLATESPAIQDG